MSDTDTVSNGRKAMSLLEKFAIGGLVFMSATIFGIAIWGITQVVDHGKALVATTKDYESMEKRLKVVEDCIPKINDKLDVIREAVKK